MKFSFGIILGSVFLWGAFLWGTQAFAAEPEYWMGPPHKCFSELFYYPEEWSETQKVIDTILFADHVINRNCSDDELKNAFTFLQDKKIKLALEVGAVKPWGTTGEKVFEIQKPIWDRFIRLGAKIDAIALDEPLVAVLLHNPEMAKDSGLNPFDYAVRETADFIELVRKNYPEIRIGDIEVYPSFDRETVCRWVDALEHELSVRQVRGMDFFRMDVDWARFTVPYAGLPEEERRRVTEEAMTNGWADVRKIEDYCRSRNMPFGLIFWAADYACYKQSGKIEDARWRQEILLQGEEYRKTGGHPEQYIVESWIEAPSLAVPDTKPDTFTGSVLEFYRHFLEKK